MDAADWDARYSAAELVWTAAPNGWVAQTFAASPAGAALDLGAGEGRNALWFAERGWQVTAVDFSAEALRKGRAVQAARAPQTLPRVTWVHADVLEYAPAPRTFSAVVVCFLHLPDAARRTVVRRGAQVLAPDGVLLVVGHDRSNPAEGVGGPADPSVLFTADDVLADLAGLPDLEIRRAERVRRPVDGHARDALDALVEVVRTRAGNTGRLV